jgi:hypothetical protein
MSPDSQASASTIADSGANLIFDIAAAAVIRLNPATLR